MYILLVGVGKKKREKRREKDTLAALALNELLGCCVVL